MNKFPFTREGWDRAYKYLDDTGQLDLLAKELSNDGYTLIALANELYKENEEAGRD